jgi:hypothetical protein
MEVKRVKSKGVTYYKIEGAEFITVDNNRNLSINWAEFDIPVSIRLDIVKKQLNIDNNGIMHYLLKESVLKRLKMSVNKKYESSYRDLILKIISDNSLYMPVYDNTYTDASRIWIDNCIQKELNILARNHKE